MHLRDTRGAPRGAPPTARSRARGLLLPFLLVLGGLLLLGIAFAGAAPNNPPTVITSGGTLAYTEDDGVVLWDTGVLVDDLDGDPIQSATVTVSAGYIAGEDVLASAGGGGVAANWNSGSGTLTLTGAAPASTYQVLLRQLTYQNASQTPTTTTRTVSVVVTDGLDPSATATRDVAVTSVHDNPVLTFTGGSLAYTEGSGAVVIDAAATVSDAEDDIVSASLQITGGYVASEDSLSYTNALGITASWNGGTGTLTLTGAATSANWQTAFRNVQYTNSSANPAAPPRTVTATVSDGSVTSTPSSRVIAISTVNDPPSPGGNTTVVAPGGGAVAVLEDTPAPGAANIRLVPPTLADVEGPAPSAVRVTAVVGGTLTQSDGSAIGLGTGGSILALSAGGVDLRFTPTPDRDTNATFTYVVVDGANPGVNSSASTATITMTPVNDAPVLGVTGGSAAFTENGGPVVVDAGVTASDIDNANLAGATVQITGAYETGADVLAGATGGGITATWTPATGTLSLSGSASLAAYQSAMRAVTFDNTSDNPSPATRTISITLNDGTAPSATLTRSVTVAVSNDAPTVTAGATASYTENAAPVTIDATVAVGDADSATLASASVAITGGHQAAEDVLTVGSPGSLTNSWDGTTGVLTLTGAASPAAYQSALRSVTYVDTSDAPDTTTRTIAFTVHDGALASTAATSTVDVVAQNDAPALGGTGGAVAYTENDVAVALDTAVTISDLDDASIVGATAQIITNFDGAEDVLGFTNQAGIVGAWSPATGTLTLTGSASRSAYETAFDSVTYVNVSDDPTTATRTVEFVVDDGTDLSNNQTIDVIVAAVNDPANVTVADPPLTFTEGDAPLDLDAALAVADLDDAAVAAARVRATAGWDASGDTLTAVAFGSVTVSSDNGTGTLSLSGPAPASDFETVLRSVQFHNAGDDPATTSRTFGFSADDGTGFGPEDSRTIDVQAVNDAPVATNDSAEVLQGELIVVDVIANDTDVDGGALTVSGWTAPADASVARSAGRLRVNPADDFVGLLDIPYDVDDGAGGTDSARLRVRVRAAADGSVVVSDTPDPILTGDVVTEVVKVRNHGPGLLHHSTVRLHSDAEFVDARGPAGVWCMPFSTHVSCVIGAVMPGTTAEVRIELRPHTAGEMTATATLSHGAVDPDTTDLRDATSTAVLTRPDQFPIPGNDPPSPTTAPPTTEPPTTSTTAPAATTTSAPTAPTTDPSTTATTAEGPSVAPTVADPPGQPTPTTVAEPTGGAATTTSTLVAVVLVAAGLLLLWQRQRLRA